MLSMAGVSTLDKHPDLRDFVALKYHEGLTYEKIASAVGGAFGELGTPHRDTIRNWKNDEGVRARIQELMLDRAARVTRKVDQVLWERLERAANEMDTDELLKIRKEFMPEVAARDTDTPSRGQITAELFGRMTDDPDLAARLKRAAENAAQ